VVDTGARWGAEAQLGELTSRQSIGRLHLGVIKWATDTGKLCDWTTDQLIDNPDKVAVAAAFPLLDQGGMPVDLYARIELDPVDPRRRLTPEQQVLSVSFGSVPAVASGDAGQYLSVPSATRPDLVPIARPGVGCRAGSAVTTTMSPSPPRLRLRPRTRWTRSGPSCAR
jgi:hypothetical protein